MQHHLLSACKHIEGEEVVVRVVHFSACGDVGGHDGNIRWGSRGKSVGKKERIWVLIKGFG